MMWSEFGLFMQNHLPFCEVLPCLSPSPFVLRASFQRSASSPDAPQPAPDPLTIEQAIHINPQCHSARLLLPPRFNMIQLFNIPNSVLSVAKPMAWPMANTAGKNVWTVRGLLPCFLEAWQDLFFLIKTSRCKATTWETIRWKRTKPCRTELRSGKRGKPLWKWSV